MRKCSARPRPGTYNRPVNLPPLPAGARHIVFYDGLCGFCDASVQRVLAADRRGVLAFAPLQGETARAALARHPVDPVLDSALVLLDAGQPGERLVARSTATLATARAVGGWFRLLDVLRLVPRPLRDRAYDFVARRRKRWFGILAQCRVPTPEQRSRFLP